MLQARLGAYIDSGESGEASDGEIVEASKTKKEPVQPVKDNKPELISLIDDSDSCSEITIKPTRRSRCVLNPVFFDI